MREFPTCRFHHHSRPGGQQHRRKTGVDLPAAKNLLGTSPAQASSSTWPFWKPSDREFTNGLAEIVKYGIVDDPELLDELDAGAEALRRRDPAFLEGYIQILPDQKGIVESDETDRGCAASSTSGTPWGMPSRRIRLRRIPWGGRIHGNVRRCPSFRALKYLSSGNRERIFRPKELGPSGSHPASLEYGGSPAGIEERQEERGSKIHFIL